MAAVMTTPLTAITTIELPALGACGRLSTSEMPTGLRVSPREGNHRMVGEGPEQTAVRASRDRPPDALPGGGEVGGVNHVTRRALSHQQLLVKFTST